MPDERRAALVVFATLAVVYLLTLAPDVTLWDSGEFNAAIGSLGIPHPPGTPLYILVARTWSCLLPGVPQAVAVNALSALATATACGLLALGLTRWLGSHLAGMGGGIAAGAMFAVWQNATETEVYALSMLLGTLMVVAGARAGRTRRPADRAMLVYLMALAIPVQISALVAAPAAVSLAGMGDGAPRPSWSILAVLSGAMLMVAGVGVVSPAVVALGVAAMAVGGWLKGREAIGNRSSLSTREVLGYVVLILVAASATLFMLVRAQHDPGINQGNPSTWPAFIEVLARRQYDVPGLWPRRAPLWLQIANLFQYADWQVAFGLDDSVAASWRRTPITVGFAVMALLGARWHWRRHPHSARATALLLASASLGVVLVLNLRAGPSIGYGLLPPDALHEARERDYFFALAFAVAALWAGAGAVWLLGRLRPRLAWMGAALAALPLVLNVSAADRGRHPDASLARALGVSLLASAPPRAVLLASGDNDTYTSWYQQQVHRRRTDVTVIVTPLLAAEWYREELRRRDGLLDEAIVRVWSGEEATLLAIAGAAERLGRPVMVSMAFPRDQRLRLRPRWVLRGMGFVAGTNPEAWPPTWPFEDGIDSAATATAAGDVAAAVPRLDFTARDGTGRYVQHLLRCPSQALAAWERRERTTSRLLDSRCNLK